MLRASIALRDGPLTLITVESAESHAHRAEGHWRVAGTLKPMAVVVCGAGAPYALDMDANALDLDELRRDVPDLDAAIASSD